jgi:hypothetical protein
MVAVLIWSQRRGGRAAAAMARPTTSVERTRESIMARRLAGV